MAIGYLVACGAGSQRVDVCGGWFTYWGKAARAHFGARDTGNSTGFTSVGCPQPASLADGYVVQWSPERPGFLALKDAKL